LNRINEAEKLHKNAPPMPSSWIPIIEADVPPALNIPAARVPHAPLTP